MTVFLQLHQHRRLTRAQSHHGSEEEKKRRKILARKVGLSPTNLQTKIYRIISYNYFFKLVPCIIQTPKM